MTPYEYGHYNVTCFVMTFDFACKALRFDNVKYCKWGVRRMYISFLIDVSTAMHVHVWIFLFVSRAVGRARTDNNRKLQR